MLTTHPGLGANMFAAYGFVMAVPEPPVTDHSPLFPNRGAGRWNQMPIRHA
jgi:hypothetical protein